MPQLVAWQQLEYREVVVEWEGPWTTPLGEPPTLEGEPPSLKGEPPSLEGELLSLKGEPQSLTGEQMAVRWKLGTKWVCYAELSSPHQRDGKDLHPLGSWGVDQDQLGGLLWSAGPPALRMLVKMMAEGAVEHPAVAPE